METRHPDALTPLTLFALIAMLAGAESRDGFASRDR